MGRASNRKRVRRQAGYSSRPWAPTQQAILQLAGGLQALSQEMETRRERRTASHQKWCAGSEPVPAEATRWPEGSLGERFFSCSYVEEARNAPCLLTANVPDANVIAADPAQWSVATSMLVRAVVFDGLGVDHPAVSALLGVLAPIAAAELAYGEAIEAWPHRGGAELDEDEPRFPELDGPVFLLGVRALVDATWAVVGDDPITEVLAVLLPVVDGVGGLEGRIVADALIGAFAGHYRCELPGDADVLERIGSMVSGDALANLVAAEAVGPGDVLRVGLTMLAALAELCKSGSASIVRQAA